MSDSLIVVVSFFFAIFVSRITVKIVWGFNVSLLKKRLIAGVSIHHFSYGLLCVIVSGYIAVATSIEHWLIPCLFGAGLGLIADELYPVHVILGRLWERVDSKGRLYWGKQAYLTLGIVGGLLAVLAIVA